MCIRSHFGPYPQFYLAGCFHGPLTSRSRFSRMGSRCALRGQPIRSVATWSCCKRAKGAFDRLSYLKIRHYSRISWLLARLEEPGIAAECIRQFNAVPEASHESVSKELMAAGSRLRPMVDNIAPDGTGVCEELRSKIQSMRDISIDDSYAEGSHASMGRIMSAARSSKWARCSSTLRLDQNLQDVHRLCKPCGTHGAA